LVPGVLTRLSPDSELKIDNLEVDKDGNETAYPIRKLVATIELRHGQLVVLFEGSANVKVKTATVDVDVLPSCLVSIDVDQTKTRINCARGDVRVKPQNGPEIMLEAGYFREWPSQNDATSTPTSEDQRAEKEAIAARDAATELEELSARQRDRLPLQ
jgi:hypothetical protein